MSNIKIFLYAFITWLSLNISGIQKIYFSNDMTLTTIVIKVLHFIFIYVILKKIYMLYIERKNPKVKNEIIISLIFFCILFLILLCIWPGAWSNDDITILKNAQIYDLTPWHHFFSGLFQVLCLQTIPIPAGVMIIQILISSLIVGYVVSNIAELFGKTNNHKIIIQVVLGLITLFPPLILYILSGFRMGIYSYLELLLITKLIILYKSKQHIDFCELLTISFLTIIVSCWRTEGFYYPFLLLILYCILGKKVISKRVTIISFFIILTINISIGKINNWMIGNNDYSIAATMEGLTSVVEASDNTDKEELDAINKIVDVEYIKSNPDMLSEDVFKRVGIGQEYTDEEYSNYLKAYFKLLLKHPDAALKNMWKMFLKAGSGFGENSQQTTHNMVNNNWSYAQDLTIMGTNAWKMWRQVDSNYKEPINADLRNDVIFFLNGTDSNKTLNIVHNIFWNLFIPCTLILVCLIYKLIKKDWFMVFLILTVVERIPIVFATAPAAYFMYYLSAYLCTYILSAIVIIEAIINLKNKKKIGGLLCEKKY